MATEKMVFIHTDDIDKKTLTELKKSGFIPVKVASMANAKVLSPELMSASGDLVLQAALTAISKVHGVDTLKEFAMQVSDRMLARP